MELKLNSVEHAQVELILEKIAAENNITNVTAVNITMDKSACNIKFAAEEEKGIGETLGTMGGKVVAPLVADVLTEGAAVEANPIISEKGGEVGGALGKGFDKLLSSDKAASETMDFSKIANITDLAQVVVDEPEQEDIDLTKYANVEELTKTAIDAYDVGQGVQNVLTAPARGLYNAGKGIYDANKAVYQGIADQAPADQAPGFLQGLNPWGSKSENTSKADSAAQPAAIVPSAGMDGPPAAAGVQQEARTTQPAAPTYGGQAPSGAGQAQQYSQNGMNPTEIADIQGRLGVAVDGIIGPDTQKALMAYQQQNGLPADGTPNQDTLAKLYNVGTGASLGYNSEQDFNSAVNQAAPQDTGQAQQMEYMAAHPQAGPVGQ